MRQFIFRRMVHLIPTLIGVSLVVFLLVQLSGDPTTLLLPPDASDADRQLFREAYGMNEPLLIQYFKYFGKMIRGDLGTSFGHNEPVMQLVMARLPATLQLTAAALLLVVVIGIPAGVISAVKKGSFADLSVTLFTLLGQSTATFWLALMLIYVFGVHLQWLPTSGRGGWEHLILPSVTLAAYMTALIARLTRSGMLETLEQDFIRTARGKGLSESVINYRHALRNTLVPIVTVLGIQFGNLLAGAIVTETVFAWPGIGMLVINSIYRRDYPVVQGVVILLALGYVLINLVTDILYGLINPSIRFD